ncbi:uncharacterized protein MYCFIDRAFT_171447 [Pseudocercospora fijiensis CIRAD86]|uniref:Uncharacterized protein n=1 Tax=Pseudocercospora fijiensis (strain CIRAD86) TaxID=383855 RepID=M3B882_PSEFD|nr:uncharacterized protein MYCFIDRAFT_171447 [Pseudocercospora fijiensis CIRAD86]EME85532.1 hypothetical protein MYCFIDRAFT_171447 [Pseudocercospora fijiensis CIRAD86]
MQMWNRAGGLLGSQLAVQSMLSVTAQIPHRMPFATTHAFIQTRLGDLPGQDVSACIGLSVLQIFYGSEQAWQADNGLTWQAGSSFVFFPGLSFNEPAIIHSAFASAPKRPAPPAIRSAELHLWLKRTKCRRGRLAPLPASTVLWAQIRLSLY